MTFPEAAKKEVSVEIPAAVRWDDRSKGNMRMQPIILRGAGAIKVAI